MLIYINETGGSGNWVTAAETKPQTADDGGRIFRKAYWDTNGGHAEITPYVIHNLDTLACVLIAYRYCGKKYNGGSSYYRFYKPTGQPAPDDWERVEWKSLDDADRMIILDSDQFPGWAKTPGKLKRDYLKPRELQRLEIDEQGTIYGYKYLIYQEGQFFSPRNGHQYEWLDGEIEADQEPTEDNTHGIYAMKNRKSKVLEHYQAGGRVLVRLALSGTVIEANEGLRAQHAQIVEVLS